LTATAILGLWVEYVIVGGHRDVHVSWRGSVVILSVEIPVSKASSRKFLANRLFYEGDPLICIRESVEALEGFQDAFLETLLNVL
jgi:hypothetical protein